LPGLVRAATRGKEAIPFLAGSSRSNQFQLHDCQRRNLELAAQTSGSSALSLGARAQSHDRRGLLGSQAVEVQARARAGCRPGGTDGEDRLTRRVTRRVTEALPESMACAKG